MSWRTKEKGSPTERSQNYLGMFPEAHHYLQANRAPSWDRGAPWHLEDRCIHFQRKSTRENMLVIKIDPTIRMTDKGDIFIKISRVNIFFPPGLHLALTDLIWCTNLKNSLRRSPCRQREISSTFPLSYWRDGCFLKNGQQGHGQHQTLCVHSSAPLNKLVLQAHGCLSSKLAAGKPWPINQIQPIACYCK